MEKWINAFVATMLEYGVIEKPQKAIMTYGLDLLFSSVISLLSIIVCGVALNVEIQTLWLLAAFIPLQSFGGGYHCKTHLRCWLLMLVGYLISVFGLIQLPAPVLWGGALLAAYSFLKLTPVEHENAPFGKEFEKRMHEIVVGLYYIALVVAAVGTWMKWIGSEGNLLQVRYTRIYMEHKAMMHMRLKTLYREALIHDAEIVQAYFRDVYRMAKLVFALSLKYNLRRDNTILKKMASMVRNINSIESVILERVENEL